MKNTIKSLRNLIILILLSVLPMAVGIAANLAIKGNVNFVFTYLDAVLWLIGAGTAYLAFKKTKEITFPKGKKPSVSLLSLAFVFGFSSTSIIGNTAQSLH